MQTYAEVKARLDEIVDAVSDESLPLDEALGLYEEAVTLGLRVSELLEQDIAARDAAADAAAAADGADAAAGRADAAAGVDGAVGQ